MSLHEEVSLLLVDDDAGVRRAYQRSLARSGWKVEAVASGKEAIGRVTSESFEVILSDIAMPEMSGVEFLRAVREHDLDVPVVLMTGDPELTSAIRAVEYGAFQYLVKPVEPALLDDTVRRAARMHKLARLKREALELLGGGPALLGDRASLEARFASALEQLWMAYQPIVAWRERRIFGYEALLRSGDPALKNPGEFLEVAERLGRLHELGRAIRARVAQAAHEAPEDALLFVNLHASDLNDDELFAAQSSLAPIARRLVLEVTERASMDAVKNPAARTQDLRAMGFRIAVDDLGAGYAGLSSFMQLEPEFAKLDMSLVRGIDSDPRRQSIVRSMKLLCDELNMLVVAEGVETASERDMLVELGCDLLQGYLFARPDRGFGKVAL
jgi:EAL domain-containing protein (putative c-di-GMP-specific phosphodiesterase class I)/ActR/RegA family two-component response regulator